MAVDRKGSKKQGEMDVSGADGTGSSTECERERKPYHYPILQCYGKLSKLTMVVLPIGPVGVILMIGEPIMVTISYWKPKNEAIQYLMI